MAEDATVTTNPAPEEEAPALPPGSKSAAATIHDEVNRILKEHHTAGIVKDRVVLHMVEETLEDRKKLVLTGISKLKEARQELSKAQRAGNQAFVIENGKSKPHGPLVQDKAQTEATIKAQEKVNKIDRSLNQALIQGEYEKLQECCK